MLNYTKTAVSVLALTMAAACATVDTPTPADTQDIINETATPTPAVDDVKIENTASDLPEFGAFGLDMTAMDTSVAAGDDFFRYGNGTWFDNFEIPADKSRYGAFTMLRDVSEARVRTIIEDLADTQPSIDTAPGKIGAFYASFLDTETINSDGLTPAQPYLDHIASIDSLETLAKTFGKAGYASPFGGYVFADPKATDEYIFQVGLDGLGLPDRDYYLKDDEKSVGIRAKYVELLTFLLTEAGYENAAEAADDVMALETAMAKTHWDRALSRNPEITYNKLAITEFIEMSGAFPVGTFLKESGLGDIEALIAGEIPPTGDELETAGISEDEATKLGGGFPAMFNLIADTPLNVWKAYLTAHFLSDHASVLPEHIDTANFAFYGTELRGTPQQRERWKRAVSATEDILGEAIGQVYVERYFPPENKAAMDELVANLRKAMGANLDDLTWMGEETKVKAREKLGTFNPKIGYPDEFETFDTLTLSDTALDNAIAATDWQWKDNISDLGKEMDRDVWFMTPQTINAYYNPLFNEIVFPAAILQPPFFNINADPAINYGAIGGVIGHEIGHGFDDQGSKFAADGSLTNWWTDEDLTAFRSLTSELKAQYDAFCPLDEGETCVNGQLTLGENIGDLGGLSLAYRAYKLHLNGEEAPVLGGLTGDQRFFLSWAQVWRAKYREEATRQQLITDPHSPPLYRVNGPVRNLDAWYEAFDIGPDHALYLPPEKRVKIW